MASSNRRNESRGWSKILRKLNKIPGAVQEELRKTVQQAADETLMLARVLVPVDTGLLRKSIRKRKSEKGLKTKIGIFRKGGAAAAQPNAKGTKRGLTAPHAHLIEFGTKKMRARPFLRPAHAKARAKFGPALKARTKAALETVARGS